MTFFFLFFIYGRGILYLRQRNLTRKFKILQRSYTQIIEKRKGYFKRFQNFPPASIEEWLQPLQMGRTLRKGEGSVGQKLEPLSYRNFVSSETREKTSANSSTWVMTRAQERGEHMPIYKYSATATLYQMKGGPHLNMNAILSN